MLEEVGEQVEQGFQRKHGEALAHGASHPCAAQAVEVGAELGMAPALPDGPASSREQRERCMAQPLLKQPAEPHQEALLKQHTRSVAWGLRRETESTQSQLHVSC